MEFGGIPRSVMSSEHSGCAAHGTSEAPCEMRLVGIAEFGGNLGNRQAPGPDQRLGARNPVALEVNHRRLAGAPAKHPCEVEAAHARNLRKLAESDGSVMVRVHEIQHPRHCVRRKAGRIGVMRRLDDVEALHEVTGQRTRQRLRDQRLHGMDRLLNLVGEQMHDGFDKWIACAEAVFQLNLYGVPSQGGIGGFDEQVLRYARQYDGPGTIPTPARLESPRVHADVAGNHERSMRPAGAALIQTSAAAVTHRQDVVIDDRRNDRPASSPLVQLNRDACPRAINARRIRRDGQLGGDETGQLTSDEIHAGGNCCPCGDATRAICIRRHGRVNPLRGIYGTARPTGSHARLDDDTTTARDSNSRHGLKIEPSP